MWPRGLAGRVLLGTLLVIGCAVFYHFFKRDDPETDWVEAGMRPFRAFLPVRDAPYVNPHLDLNRLKQVGTACKIYASDFDDQLPPDLLYLVPEYLPDNEYLADSPELFHSGERFGDLPSDTVILSGKKNRRGKVPVVYADGSGVYLDADSVGK